MKPREIRYSVGKGDNCRVHNTLDKISYEPQTNLHVEVSGRARLIEQACEKSFSNVVDKETNIPVVLAPKNHYHVSGIIRELTPELQQVSLTLSERNDTSIDQDSSISSTSIQYSNQSSSHTHESSSRPDDENQGRHTSKTNSESLQDSIPLASKTTHKYLASHGTNIKTNNEHLSEPGLGVMLESRSANTKVEKISFAYHNVKFNVAYEESAELELISRLAFKSTVIKCLKLGKKYSNSALKEIGIQKPQDIPFRISIEVLPTLANLFLSDYNQFSQLINISTSDEASDDFYNNFVTKLTNKIQTFKESDDKANIKQILTSSNVDLDKTSFINLLAYVIFDVINSEDHPSIHQIKDLFKRCRKSAVEPPSNVPFLDVTNNLEKELNYKRYFPLLIYGIAEVIFKQFYILHNIINTDIRESIYSASLSRLLNICIFFLACILLSQYYKNFMTESSSGLLILSPTTASASSLYKPIIKSLLDFTKPWLKDAQEKEGVFYSKKNIHVKMAGWFDDSASIHLFMQHYLLQQVTADSIDNPVAPVPFIENSFLISDHVHVTAETPFYRNRDDVSLLLNSMVRRLFGLTSERLEWNPNSVISVFDRILNYIKANPRCSSTMSEIINSFLKLMNVQKDIKATEIGNRIGGELARLCEKIGKILPDNSLKSASMSQMSESTPAPAVFVCILLMFLQDVLLRAKDFDHIPIHIFVQKWEDLIMLLYPLTIFNIIAMKQDSKNVFLKISTEEGMFLKNIAISLDEYVEKLIRTISPLSSQPEVLINDSTDVIVIDIKPYSVELNEDKILRSTKAMVTIIVHMNTPKVEDLSSASLITNTPCQLAIVKQLVQHCNRQPMLFKDPKTKN